jgi:hypothetical protein
MPKSPSLAEQLHVSSRLTEKKHFKKGGKLHSSAIGSIYYAVNTPTPCIIKTLDLGDQNIYCVSTSNQTTLRGTDSKHVLMIHNSKREARQWKDTWCNPDHWPHRSECSISKIVWLQESIHRDGALKLLRLNEYLCEAYVGILLAKQLKVPHIAKSLEAYVDFDDSHDSRPCGHILQDYAGISLFKNMADLNLAQFKSIVMQILVTLALSQKYFFKHHDVHLENIFYNKGTTETWNQKLLTSSKTWTYKLDNGLSICIEHQDILAKLGDFGLASITDLQSKTRIERVDYSILNGGEEEWGEWSGKLEGQKSYDIAVFLSKFFLDEEIAICPSENIKWAQSLYVAIQSLTKMECSMIGRPFRGREGNFDIQDLFKLSVFAEFWASQEDTLQIN